MNKPEPGCVIARSMMEDGQVASIRSNRSGPKDVRNSGVEKKLRARRKKPSQKTGTQKPTRAPTATRRRLRLTATAALLASMLDVLTTSIKT